MGEIVRLPQVRAKAAGHAGAQADDSSANKQSPALHQTSGRLFPDLPPARFEDKDLAMLALAIHHLSNGSEHATPVTSSRFKRTVNADENGDIPAGYTFLQQFIEHDLTFKPATTRNDPPTHRDRRVAPGARFNLDPIYIGGPEDHPYLFDPNDERKFSLGASLSEGAIPCNARDLPRFNRRALIGDKRDDENVILSQLHGAFLQFHNNVAEYLGKDTAFADIQREVRWHYQYIVLNDFLPRLCGRPVIYDILPHLRSGRSLIGARPRLRFYKWIETPLVPAEFATTVPCIRHATSRNSYRLNQVTTVEHPSLANDANSSGRPPRPDQYADRSMAGFREFPNHWAIDWRMFFGDTRRQVAHALQVQAGSRIDFALVGALHKPDLGHAREHGHAQPGLSAGNVALSYLRQANALGLPSGQEVARAIGIEPLPPGEIIIGKAAVENAGTDRNSRPIAEIAPQLGEQTPLWIYILAEAGAQWRTDVARRDARGATANAISTRLGAVGSRIVAETVIGILLADENSFLRQDPSWLPWATWDGDTKRNYTMMDVLRFAGLMP